MNETDERIARARVVRRVIIVLMLLMMTVPWVLYWFLR
jgi:hypothetical protein